MKLPLLLILTLSMGIAHAADITEADIAAALEARYGPFAQNEALAVSVKVMAEYDGVDQVKDEALPSDFHTIVWDKKTDRFAALVGADGDKPVRIAGSAVLERRMPVPVRRIAPGQVLTADDVEMRPLKAKSSSDENSVSTMDQVIGKEATKLISPDRLIPLDSITAPAAVRKNENVILVFRKGGLELNAKGKSLDNAAIGEGVKITRKDAARVLEGRVIGEGVVMVSEIGSIR